jgi:hypothetical protein
MLAIGRAGKDFGFGGQIESSNRDRIRNVRHCWADILKTQKNRGFRPRTFPSGLEDVLRCSFSGPAVQALSEADTKLELHGLLP